MADLAEDGRANLERQKRFLLALTVIVAAYFALGARVCDTATYSGFLVTIARPEHARSLLLIVWAWSLLTYLQRLYKLFTPVRGSIEADVDDEDWRLAHRAARRAAKDHLAKTDLPALYCKLRVGRKIDITSRRDTAGGTAERMYEHLYGGRMYGRVVYRIHGIEKSTGEPWSSEQTFTMTWEPKETRFHRLRAWSAALLRRPGMTEHFGPLVAVLLAVGAVAQYWNNPPHPSDCRSSEQSTEAANQSRSELIRDESPNRSTRP